MKMIEMKIQGVVPLIMHNGDLANRNNRFTREIAAINKKKSKRTDLDFDRLERLEWEGGLWQKDGKPCIPADAIHALVIGGARKTRSGKVAEAGVWCDEDALVEYSGPKTIDGLYENKQFVDQRGVRVQRSRIIRTRPIFRAWSATIKLVFDPNQTNEQDVREWVRVGGEQIGLGDYRPRFGRFLIAA